MASLGYPLQYIPYELAADVAAQKFVALAGDRMVQEAAGHAAPIMGTTERPGLMGEEASIAVLGDLAVEAGGAVARGALVTADSDGNAIALVRPRIRTAVVTGAAANTNIAVTGILTVDELVSVVEFAQTSNDPTDRTNIASITSDGNIQLTGTTANDNLLVVWKEAPRWAAGVARQAAVDGQIMLVHFAPQMVTA